MKWIKASHRLPDKPGKYLFRVIGGGYDEDTAYYVQGVSEKDFEQWVKTSSKPASHEWLDETIARKDERKPPFIVAEVREYLNQLLNEDITFSRFVELLNTRPKMQKKWTHLPIYNPQNKEK